MRRLICAVGFPFPPGRLGRSDCQQHGTGFSSGCTNSRENGSEGVQIRILVVAAHPTSKTTNEPREQVNHLLYTIAKCLPVICEAEKCTCFLVDDDKDQLWVVQGEVNMRVPKSKGIAGAVATSGKVRERAATCSGFDRRARTNDENHGSRWCWYLVISMVMAASASPLWPGHAHAARAKHHQAENISDVYADPRFNKEVDLETGFQTHSILAMPVRGGEENK